MMNVIIIPCKNILIKNNRDLKVTDNIVEKWTNKSGHSPWLLALEKGIECIEMKWNLGTSGDLREKKWYFNEPVLVVICRDSVEIFPQKVLTRETARAWSLYRCQPYPGTVNVFGFHPRKMLNIWAGTSEQRQESFPSGCPVLFSDGDWVRDILIKQLWTGSRLKTEPLRIFSLAGKGTGPALVARAQA